jgi:acyl-coenzyme A synthetase/AMP-(fatty) acid ligase
MITPTPVVPLKPGSGTRPFFGQEAEIVDEQGKPGPDDTEGYLVLKNPWPSMLRTIYGDDERYVSTNTGASTPANTPPAIPPNATRTATTGSSAAWTM